MKNLLLYTIKPLIIYYELIPNADKIIPVGNFNTRV